MEGEILSPFLLGKDAAEKRPEKAPSAQRSVVWNDKSFAGTGESFLFTLRPRMGVYSSSGYNQNYMYLNQNQETMPNGLVSIFCSRSL